MIHTVTIPVVVTIDEDTNGGTMSIIKVDIPADFPDDFTAHVERFANAAVARWVSMRPTR